MFSSLLKQAVVLLFRRHGLDNLDLTAIVAAALLAHSVRQVQSTALGACNETGEPPASRWSCVAYRVLLWILFP